MLPDPLPGNVADFPNFTWREYGLRVGVWRMFRVFEHAGVPLSCTFNAKSKPVVSSNLATFWQALRAAGIADRLPRWSRALSGRPRARAPGPERLPGIA